MALPVIPGGFTGGITVCTGDLILSEGADGSVAAMIAAQWPVTLSLTGTAGRELARVDVDLMVSTLDYSSSFGGTPDDVRATSTFERMLITLERLDIDVPGGAEPLDIDMLLALQGGETRTRILQQGGVEVRDDGTIARVVVDYSFNYFDMQSRTVSEPRDSRYASRMVVPDGGFDMLNLGPALRAGLDLSASAESGLT